ncbi:uncharacterized protein LOC123313795 isoform X2 [Coccinella septempunctata]|uniref:uncharacterized protein LOC123313795 isoform X2 n=1 Tax=Coccinella septempunctata TaxID=41139 RepID=UPI001D078A98|nr:uncharacterized protein LOC123313795 isoform X2 [Coccinella septempunctata]
MELHPMIFYFFMIFGTLTNSIIAREEWVDPHDMNIRINPVRKEIIKKTNNEESYSCDCNNNFYKDESSNHLRKVVSLLTDMTYFDRGSYVYRGIIDINLNADDYDFLKKYVSADWNEDFVLSQLSAVLEKSLGKSIYNSFTIGEYIYLTIFNENILLCLGLLILSYVLWKIQPHNYKLTTLFKLFFPLVYLSDFVLRYKAKLEEVEIDKYLQYENFKSCDPDRLGFFDWVINKFTGYCQKEKRNFMLSQRAAFHIFTPLNIISDQFDIFVNIFKHLGAGLGSFIWALLGSSNQKKNSSVTFRTKPKFSLRKKKPRVVSSCNQQVVSFDQDRINEPETVEKSID